MTEIQLGKVMLTFKGEYDSTNSYTRLDAVTYQGSSYVCLSDTSSAPPGDSWQLLADKGATGDVGPQGPKGDKGDTGAIGPAGPAGKNGVTPDVSNLATKTDLAGYYTKTETDTKLSSKANLKAQTVTSGTLASLGPGVYDVGFIASDAPESNWGMLQVDAGSNYVKQIYTARAGTSLHVYVRMRTVTSQYYDPWNEVTIDTSDFVKQSGLTNYYTKSETDEKLAGKADKSDIPTTMAWNSITDKPNLVTKDELPKVEGYQVQTVTSGQLADLTTGTYEVDFSPEDAPCANWGLLQVSVGDHYAQQIFSNAGATNGASQTWIRTRNYDKSEYDAWQQISLPNATDWSTTGVTYSNGAVQDSNNPLKYRVINLGKIHRVEVTGWVTTTIYSGRFNSCVQIPRMGFENATKMSFSGDTTLSAYGDIVSFFAGQPGEINLFSGSKTLNNAHFQINCHWIYEE